MFNMLGPIIRVMLLGGVLMFCNSMASAQVPAGVLSIPSLTTLPGKACSTPMVRRRGRPEENPIKKVTRMRRLKRTRVMDWGCSGCNFPHEAFGRMKNGKRRIIVFGRFNFRVSAHRFNVRGYLSCVDLPYRLSST